MIIEKNKIAYTVKENKSSWTVSKTDERIEISFNIPKAECGNFDELKEFVATSNLF